MTRCACGYPEEYHEAGLCPLCACGATRKAHAPATDIPTPLWVLVEAVGMIPWPRETTYPCPGKDTVLRGGRFREPERVATRSWFGMTVPVFGDSVRHEHRDRTPRRRAQHADEVAPAAVQLGRKAYAAGWVVDAYFRELHDGVQWSIIAFARGTGERAVGVWRRPAGGKWLFRAAAHGPGRVPIGAARLKSLILD